MAECTYYIYIWRASCGDDLYRHHQQPAVPRGAASRRQREVFTRRYKVTQLVWFEELGDVDEAIQREKSLKRYLRDWKTNLIERDNPHWEDLFPALEAKYSVPEGPEPPDLGSSGQARG
jgi:putative endonuclease